MNIFHYKKQQGLTIIEIMIAILLSTLLLTGVIQIFVSTKHSYRIQDGLSRIQENGRFGIQMISQDVQMGGFYGCNDGQIITNHLNDSTDLQFQYDYSIAGYNDLTSTPALLTSANTSITPDTGTDVIIIRRPEGEPYRLAGISTKDNITIEAPSVISNLCNNSATMVNGFCPGDIMLVADCNKSIVFQSGTFTVSGTPPNRIATITHPTGSTPGNSKDEWGGVSDMPNQFANDANSVVYHLATIMYYVQTVNGIPTLFRYQNGDFDALVDGVEDMQIQYGEDTNNDGIADSYVDAFAYDATTQARWNSIVATKIKLLIRSVNNNLTEQTLSYSFNGNTVTTANMASDDKYIRREFVTTVALRNHAS
ncbi:MAG: PilW family protein [Gammaproteobacteria bacterium]